MPTELPVTWITYGLDAFDPMKFRSPSNCWGRMKPVGGLWASPYKNGTSSWKIWCINEGFHRNSLNRNFQFHFRANSRIAIINSRKDFLDLLTTYPLKNEHVSYLEYLDWEKITKDYDAVYLTEHGLHENRYPRDERFLEDLSSWDVESCVILNPEIISVCKEETT